MERSVNRPDSDVASAVFVVVILNRVFRRSIPIKRLTGKRKEDECALGLGPLRGKWILRPLSRPG